MVHCPSDLVYFTLIQRPEIGSYMNDESEVGVCDQGSQGSATRPVNTMVLMVDSRMSRRKGLLATNISRFEFMERPTAITAVAAAASLPSSFTCNSCLFVKLLDKNVLKAYNFHKI